MRFFSFPWKREALPWSPKGCQSCACASHKQAWGVAYQVKPAKLIKPRQKVFTPLDFTE